jgi:hypothetical protein
MLVPFLWTPTLVNRIARPRSCVLVNLAVVELSGPESLRLSGERRLDSNRCLAADGVLRFRPE